MNQTILETVPWEAIATTPLTLGTPVTNGQGKRMVICRLICTSNGGGTAYASITTNTIAGTSATITNAIGNSTSGTGAQCISHDELIFVVDPNATYTVSASISGGGTVSVASTWAIDL